MTKKLIPILTLLILGGCSQEEHLGEIGPCSKFNNVPCVLSVENVCSFLSTEKCELVQGERPCSVVRIGLEPDGSIQTMNICTNEDIKKLFQAFDVPLGSNISEVLRSRKKLSKRED